MEARIETSTARSRKNQNLGGERTMALKRTSMEEIRMECIKPRAVPNKNLFYLALVALLLPGCMAMFAGSTESIGLGSEPSGAKATVDGQEYTTPTTVELSKDSNHTIVFSKEGYQDSSAVLSSSLNGWWFADVLLWGPLALVDFSNGSAYHLSPDNVTVLLAPKDSVIPRGWAARSPGASPRAECK